MKFPDRLTVPGKLTISLSHSGDGADVFRVEVEDATAHVAFLLIEIPPEEFALALAARAYRPCKLTLNGLDRVGTVFEHKTENLPEIPYSAIRSDDEERRALLAAHVLPWEVDGWIGQAGDLLNNHNRNKDGSYRVGFVRWVPAPVGGAS